MTRLSDQYLERLRTACGPPEKLGGRYRIERELGRGGMGVVYLAFDEQLERRVAIKMLEVTNVDARLAAHLRREAQLLGQLEHPGIVSVHDLGLDADETLYYVMRYVDGRTLEEHATTMGNLTARLRLLLRICEPVAFAHARGIVHRDLKPSNVMIGQFGEVWVMDWGLATFAAQDPTRMTEAGVAVGTPGYRAPEQEQGSGEVTSAADVYALGGLLAFLLTGQHPPLDKPSHLATMPAPVRAIADKARATDPGERYPSVFDLAADLGRYLDGERVSAYDEPWYGAVRRWLVRYQFIVTLILMYLIVRLLVAVWGH
jgi:serine/threonine protein kinase